MEVIEQFAQPLKRTLGRSEEPSNILLVGVVGQQERQGSIQSEARMSKEVGECAEAEGA